MSGWTYSNTIAVAGVAIPLLLALLALFINQRRELDKTNMRISHLEGEIDGLKSANNSFESKLDRVIQMGNETMQRLANIEGFLSRSSERRQTDKT